jgi:cytochrome P450
VIKEIVNNEELFRKHPLLYDTVEIVLGKGLVSSFGEHWKMQRKLLSPLFHFGALKNMIPCLSEQATHWIEE